MRDASPHEAGVAGLSQRGPGARVRGRLDRITSLAISDPAAALPILDDFLGELQTRRSGQDDPLELDTLESLAKETIQLRNTVVFPQITVGKGFRTEFVHLVADGATYSDWALGVPASITIAQAILESDWGRSAPGHNLFGLKGEGPEGSTFRKVVEYKGGHRSVRRANFRAYPDVAGSLLDHAKILARSRHYARARAVAESPAAYAAALQGTYATDPRYAGKLTALIARYSLDRLDWNAHSPWI